MKSIYVAHPYGGDPSEREDAKRWVREIALLGYAPEAMWCVLTEVLDESHKGLGLQIDRHQVSRCDLVLLTGSHVSTGMREEEWEARKRGISVLNLCGLSPLDAWVGKSIAAIIEADGEEQDGRNAAMRDLANVIVERDAYRKALEDLRAAAGRERLDLVRRADKAENERDEALLCTGKRHNATRIGHDPEIGCDGGDYGDVCPLVRYDGCLNACAICGETCSRPAPQACPLRNGAVVVTHGS
jgi:hypothetical protein